ncbi:MAG: PaRep2b protein [Thermoproteus sp.]
MERVGEEVWGVVEFALSDMYCLARDCARDEVARKFVAPALELMMLEKAASGEFDRREALLRFGEMYATAIAGDGAVVSRKVELAVGGELGGGATLLRLATLRLLNELLPEDLKFGVHTYVGKGIYLIDATVGDAARLMRLLAVAAPSAGGGYLSPKFDGFVEEARVEVRLDEGSIRLTPKGRVAADLIISEAGVDVKFNVYLRGHDITVQFSSADRGRAELAARLLKLAGINAEMKRVGERDEWRVRATTDRLAAGRRELRDALAEIVREALAKDWVETGKAERWLDKLRSGLTLREGWPKYKVGLVKGALVVRYMSTDPEGIKQVAQRLEAMGLEEGRHFSVKKPKGGKAGYVRILREGLERAAWLSVHGSGEQQRLAAEFVEYMLQRAGEEGREVYKKAEEIVRRGREVDSMRLTDIKGREVDVGGRRHVVTVLGGGAQFDKSWSGKTLLRITITAEVDGVRGKYIMTFGRRGADNETKGYAYGRADAPGGKEADAERLSALVEALTGKKPRVRRMGNKIVAECGREHLEGFMRYAELADAIERWLEETGRRQGGSDLSPGGSPD